jgi:hypothetical protein
MPVREGSGNVVARDVLRMMAEAPESVSAFLDECALAGGADAHAILDRALPARSTSDSHGDQILTNYAGLHTRRARPRSPRLLLSTRRGVCGGAIAVPTVNICPAQSLSSSKWVAPK